MATAQSSAMAFASPAQSIAIPNGRDFATKSGIARGLAMLTPPNSISPSMPAHGAHHAAASVPLLNIEEEINLEDGEVAQGTTPPQELVSGGLPLSRGALSGLDASAAITPAMLAKDYLPGIMLGNGPIAIRIVIGELNHSVPGFSRIPPTKARRLVVAALESRAGGGPEGNIAFCKTGWGRWDAHVKGSSRDSAIGSFNEGRYSPPRSERSSFAMSYNDSALGMSGPPKPCREHYGESWTNSGSHREEDELDHMDMDVPENEADKMSLDGDLPTESEADSDSATDEEDWSIPGPVALRKASLPTPGMPRQNYQALSIPMSMRRPSQAWSRRHSGMTERSMHSSSVPCHTIDHMNQGQQTPEERAAVEALLQLGSM